MGRHAAPSRQWSREHRLEKPRRKRKAPWIVAGVVAAGAVAAGAVVLTSDNPDLTLRKATVAQGDVIESADGRNCVIGVTDVTRAWTSESCARPGEDVVVGGRVIGVGGDVSANGLATIDLHSFVNARNDFEDVTVTPRPKSGNDFDGVDVCATGTEGTIYGCETIASTGDYVATVDGFHNVPAGTPVWVRSSVSDSDPNAAQLLGLVAVPGEGQDNPAIVSLIPLIGDDGSIVGNTVETDGPVVSEGTSDPADEGTDSPADERADEGAGDGTQDDVEA